jgi:DNA-binding CsgD family transcriptional regulator
VAGPGGPAPDDLLVVAVRIGDPALVERVAALLADVPGLRLAIGSEPADLLLSTACAEPPGEGNAGLTAREAEVLALLAEGASNKAIARRLGISVHTAKFHVGQLLDKLDAPGRAGAVAHAARRGVIQL